MKHALLGATLITVGVAAGTTTPMTNVRVSTESNAAILQEQYPYTPADGRFIFARIYHEARTGRGMRGFGRGEPPWHHDYPFAEQNLTTILREITYLWPYTGGGNVFELHDPRLMDFPVAYMSEPGFWMVGEKEAEALRKYLLKGGFIIFDDFGGRDMYNLVDQMKRVLPELDFLPLDASDRIFDSFFQMDPESLNLPSYRGLHPDFYGMFIDNDKRKRMVAIAANNADFGEFWEARETGFYIVDLANEAYKIGVNYIMYPMTH